MCKEVYGYVYMVKNLVNGKLYFGITVNDFDTRYNGNITKYTHNEHLKNSIEKYGIENFEINKEFDVAYTEDDLWDLEDMYICLYNTLDSKYGYNKKRSGSKHKGNGRPNKETREKLGVASKNAWLDPNSKFNSLEFRKQKSENVMGEKNPMYGKCGELNSLYGTNLTEERKQILSEQKKEHWENIDSVYNTETYRQRLSQGISNAWNNPNSKYHTDEYQQRLKKMSEERAKQVLEQGLYKGDKNPNAKSVICLETKQMFTTMKEAGEWCGLKASDKIGECCRKSRKSAGKHPITKEKLHWMFYKDYLELNNTEEIDSVTDVA